MLLDRHLGKEAADHWRLGAAARRYADQIAFRAVALASEKQTGAAEAGRRPEIPAAPAPTPAMVEAAVVQLVPGLVEKAIVALVAREIARQLPAAVRVQV